MGVTSVSLQVMHIGIRLVLYTDVYRRKTNTQPGLCIYSRKVRSPTWYTKADNGSSPSW